MYTQLHLGLGSFHRAHQAVYLQYLHDRGDQRWQIIGGNLRPDMAELMQTLKNQQGAYTLETVTPRGERSYLEIRAIRDIVLWDAKLAGLQAVAAAADTRIISFTVTEAGYYLDANDQLDLSHHDLQTDLEGRSCCTLYGAMARLLQARKDAGSGPVTLMNCDNLRSNGSRFYSGLMQFLERRNALELKQWVADNTLAPNAMVDRITPRPTAEVATRVKAATGRDDPAALMSEDFLQWVIEDHFIAGRPDWEAVDVIMTDDVMPYEEAKIRLLNATHSCIAWAGTLIGYRYIHEGTLDPRVRQLAYDYVSDDAIPCLNRPEAPSPLDLQRYRDVVLDRFGNPAIEDTNQRVAMDGFSKIPGFIAPTLRERLARQESIASVAMLPALFLAFLQRQQRGEIPYPYEDQAMDPAVAQRICNADDVVLAFASERLLFDELAGQPPLIDALRLAMQRVERFIREARS